VESHNRIVGASGEEEAALFFFSQGFEIVEKNYRYGRTGEIDLIVFKDEVLVFVEVKKRLSDRFGGALYSISRRKAVSLRSAARQFLACNPRYYRSGLICRFDLLAIEQGAIVWHHDVLR
jgi:putative endonuclease